MSLTNKVAQFDADSDLVNAWVHGPASGAGSTVATGSGTVRTPAKLIADNEAELQAVIDLTNGWANGNATATTVLGGVPVSSPAKLIADKETQINVGADGVLALSTVQAGISTAQAVIATTQADLATAEKSAAVVAKTAAELAAVNALISAGSYTTEALGRAAVADGVAFKVQGSGDVAAYEYRRTNSTTSVLIATYPSANITSLTINAGKEAPLKNIIRDGVNYATPVTAFLNGILDIKVIGARPGKYYRLEYYSHNYSTFGYQMLFSEYDAATYATAAVETKAVILSDILSSTIESGDIITRVFVSTRIAGVSFVVTYRPSAFSDDTYYLLNSAEQAGFGSVIDPANYVLASTAPVAASQLSAIPASAIAANILELGEGKNYPLKTIIRDGTTSVGSVIVNNSLLDIKVYGARTGKYYRLGWYGNGTTAFGAPNYQMLFDEFDAATYATSSATGFVEAIKLNDIPSTSIEAGSIITRTFVSTRIKGLVFVVTYKPSAMPETGTSIDMLSSPGGYMWSWVIDPACYSYSLPPVILAENLPTIPLALLPDTLAVNSGKAYPLKSATFNGVTSTINSIFADAVLDIKAVGIPAGQFLRFSWYGNGTLAFGAANYGMIFELASAATYASSNVVELLIAHTNTTYDEQIVSGTVRTRTYKTTNRAGVAISVTYDKAKFDATLGTSVVANYSGFAGYSWIVDPVCYLPEATPVVVPTQLVMAGPLVYSHTDSETLIAWRYSDTQDIRVSIGRYGVNLVNDIGSISLKTHDGLGLSLGGTWVVMNARTTDWIGPFIVNADAGGSGSTTQFTGANHGYTGGSGAATAEQVYRRAYANGRPLITNDTGFADQITFQWENLVQGSNTRDVPRYILREQHSFTVRPGSIETSARVTALEALTVTTYYGLQAYLSGFNTTVHFLNGQQSGRIAWANGLSSGAISDYPNAWATNIQGANGFNLLMWTDRSYGVANLTNLSPTKDLFFTSSNKAYTRMIEGALPYSMATGDSFVWRGGYAMAPNLGVGIDFGARYYDAGKETVVAALSSAGSGRIALQSPDTSGKALTVQSGAVVFSERIEPDGVAVSAGQYAVGFAQS